MRAFFTITGGLKCVICSYIYYEFETHFIACFFRKKIKILYYIVFPKSRLKKFFKKLTILQTLTYF